MFQRVERISFKIFSFHFTSFANTLEFESVVSLLTVLCVWQTIPMLCQEVSTSKERAALKEFKYPLQTPTVRVNIGFFCFLFFGTA